MLPDKVLAKGSGDGTGANLIGHSCDRPGSDRFSGPFCYSDEFNTPIKDYDSFQSGQILFTSSWRDKKTDFWSVIRLFWAL